MSKVGRNDPCTCGSGKKYKKCCIDKQQIRSAPVKKVKETEKSKPAYAAELKETIKKGYKKAVSNQAVEACKIWESAWCMLKNEIAPDLKSIEAVDQHLDEFGLTYNWCQEFEAELNNAGVDNPAFFEKRVSYCREFVELLPESDPLIIENMRRAEAEAYFMAGNPVEGEKKFRALIEDFPGSAWAHISWGDMYWLFRKTIKTPPDYQKAEEIYREALTKNIDERAVVLERLEDLTKASTG